MTKRKRMLLIVLVSVATFPSLMIVTVKLIRAVLIRSVQGVPYQITLRPSGAQTVIQFRRPDRGLVSPEFRVNLPGTAQQVVDLRAGLTVIPGGTIVFRDTTILPGRFQIRIGPSLYDVMERAILVNGEEFEWRCP